MSFPETCSDPEKSIILYLANLIDRMDVIITIIIYAGIVQGFFISWLLILTKRHNGANKYLAILLAAMSLSIAHSVFVIPEIHKAMEDPFRIREPFLMLIIPLIWLYVRKLQEPQYHFSLHSAMHFIPFIVFMSVSIPAFMHSSPEHQQNFLSDHAILFDSAIWLVLLIQYSAYLVQILKITGKYRVQAEEELSNLEQVDISWLRVFLYSFIIVLVLLAVMFVTAMHNIPSGWMNNTVSVVFTIIIFVLGSKGLFQKSIYPKPELPTKTESKIRPVNEELKNTLLKFMEAQKPQREFELTLTSLAAMVKMSRNQLSEVINTGIGCSFYDFINRYRVEDVKQMMAIPSYNKYTLLAIGFEAGFSSKSTFNSIFRKFTGLTPSEYRKSLL